MFKILRSNRFSLLLLGLLLVGSYACKKEELKYSDLRVPLNPEVGFPLVSGTIRADKAIESLDEDDLISVSENGQVNFVYSDSLRSLTVSEYVEIPNQEFTDEFTLDDEELNALALNGTVTVSNFQFETFELPEGDELDSLRVENAQLSIKVETDGNVPFSGFVRLLNADGTTAVIETFDGNTPPLLISETLLYQDVLFLFSDESGTGNTIGFEYEVTYQNGGNQNLTADVLTIEVELNDVVIHTIGGILAPRDFIFEDLDVEIEAFERDFEGSFVISDPRLRIDIDNGFGLGVQLDLGDVNAVNQLGESFSISENTFGDLPLIQGAPSMMQSAFTSVFVDNGLAPPNNISQLISFEPIEIDTDLKARLNPDALPVFASILNELSLIFSAEVPVFGSVSDFVLRDTAETNLGDFIADVNENQELEFLEFRFFADNGLPIDLGCQITFTDSSYNPLDSLFVDETFLIESAPVNYMVSPDSPDYGRAIGKTSTFLEIPIERDRIPPLEEAAFILIRYFGSTTDNGEEPIRIFSEDELDFDLAVKALVMIE